MLRLLPKQFVHFENVTSKAFYLAPKTCFIKSHFPEKVNFSKHFQPERFLTVSTHKKDGWISRLRKKIADKVSDKDRANYSGRLVYEKCADNIDYKEFFDCFKLEDSFHSWFLAMELHVWMCMVVAISEKCGRIFRNGLGDAMWKDIELRLDELKNDIPSSSLRKKYLRDISDQFKAALISYDEGISFDDTVLAAALWRTLFSYQHIDPRILEKAVLYVRKQVSHLNSLHTEDYIKHAAVTFLPLNTIFSQENLG